MPPPYNATGDPPVSSAPTETHVQDIDLTALRFDSTYDALSSCVDELDRIGRRTAKSVSRAELDKLVKLFEEKKVDMSNLAGFPYDAPDLDKCISLLARIQNRCALLGAPNNHHQCTVRDIVQGTLLNRSDKSHRYDIGEWVEVRGPSMRWRLEMISDIIKLKGSTDDDDDGDGDETFIYETCVDHNLTERELRWPTEALKLVFGISPWTWQQWACLRLEHKMRFQEGHPDDFEVIDIREYAHELWRCWLYNEKNKDFRELFERVGSSGQSELVDHIMKPFDLMHQVVTNEDDKWNFEDAGISIFTYVSVLGSGFFDAFIVLLLQVSMPVILFFYYTGEGRDDESIAAGTKEMLFVVLIYYLFKVNRDALLSNFNHVAGISDSVNSKIQSLRKNVWDKGNDSFSQSLGYSGDLFMNTGYICYLYIFNIFILFNVKDPFELLGSVVFFEFLFDLDEEVAATSWWDDSKRFLKAGVVQMIIQNTIEKQHSKSRSAFIRKVGSTMLVEEETRVLRKLDDLGLSESARFLRGNESSSEMELLTISEMVEQHRRAESRAALPNDHKESIKPKVYFAGLFGSDSAMFERHSFMRAWSQWEDLLFIAPVPSLVASNYVPGSKLQIADDIGDIETFFDHAEFLPGKTEEQRFYVHIGDVLSCRYMYRVYNSASNLEISKPFFFTRVIHGIFIWQSYAVQILFPICTVVALAMVYSDGYCTLHLGTCEVDPYDSALF